MKRKRLSQRARSVKLSCSFTLFIWEVQNVEMKDVEFIVFMDGCRGYIVKRKHGEYKQHAHLHCMNGCRELIRLIDLNLLPKNKWLQGSCRRLLTEAEYNQLKKPKDRYYNRGNYKKK